METKYGREKASQIMPETYILSRNKDIKKLILDYKPNRKYILKKNVQRKKGILLTKNLKEILMEAVINKKTNKINPGAVTEFIEK